MRQVAKLIKPTNALVGAIILCAISCLPEPAGEGHTPTLGIPDHATITIGDSPLNETQIASLREVSVALKRTTEPVTTKPDFEIRIQAPGAAEPEILSVWLEERFLYEGFYLDAWTERMQADAAQGYRLDATTRKFMETIRDELKNTPSP